MSLCTYFTVAVATSQYSSSVGVAARITGKRQANSEPLLILYPAVVDPDSGGDQEDQG